ASEKACVAASGSCVLISSRRTFGGGKNKAAPAPVRTVAASTITGWPTCRITDLSLAVQLISGGFLLAHKASPFPPSMASAPIAGLNHLSGSCLDLPASDEAKVSAISNCEKAAAGHDGSPSKYISLAGIL